MRLKARGRRRVPPARPRLEQRYVERAIYLALVRNRISADDYVAALRRQQQEGR
jgi:hypothetical protein